MIVCFKLMQKVAIGYVEVMRDGHLAPCVSRLLDFVRDGLPQSDFKIVRVVCDKGE